MRTNNKQKIKVLKEILQQIVDKSKCVSSYSIKTIPLKNGEMYVDVLLIDIDGTIIAQSDGRYDDVKTWAKLTLYPLLE